MPSKPLRLQSIDVFRALTMFFMVFVNDLDPIPGVPEWIKHVGRNTDGLGFADTIFPAFLFIVGLSIPFALRKRIEAGDITHIFLRSFALICMGFFQVNLESYNTAAAVLPKALWEICITVAFFAIWLDYPKTMSRSRRMAIQGAGVMLLVVMGILYRGGQPDQVEWLKPQWWGILGLIGWSYLLCAVLFWLSKGRAGWLVAGFLFFLAFNIADHAGWLDGLSDVHDYVWIVGNGAMPAMTMGGVVIGVWYMAAAGGVPAATATGVMAASAAAPVTAAPSPGKARRFRGWLVLAGALAIAAGFALRSLGGISKIHDTPSWVLICTGISILVFDGLIYLVDVRGRSGWFKWIKPAGTSTLTCYLVPYLLYSLYTLCHVKFPTLLNEGTGGLIKSLLTAYFVVWITGMLERRRLRLKI